MRFAAQITVKQRVFSPFWMELIQIVPQVLYGSHHQRNVSAFLTFAANQYVGVCCVKEQ